MRGSMRAVVLGGVRAKLGGRDHPPAVSSLGLPLQPLKPLKSLTPLTPMNPLRALRGQRGLRGLVLPELRLPTALSWLAGGQGGRAEGRPYLLAPFWKPEAGSCWKLEAPRAAGGRLLGP